MPEKRMKFLAAVIFLGHLALGACECADDRIGANLAELQAMPDPVVFGEVPVSTVKTIDVTLENRGTATVFLHALAVTENEADFSLSVPEEIVFPQAIPPGNRVIFTVRYHPQDYPADDRGTVHITSTDKDAPEYDLLCKGTAVEPILLVKPVPVDFGSVRVMSTEPATLSVEHTGSSPDPVTISAITLTDDGDGDFEIQDAADTPLILNPGDDTKIHLSYTPQLVDDSDEGTLRIESDAESQKIMDVPLLGSSHAPRIEVSTTALNFGTVSQGANPTLPFSIKSTGNDPLTITELRLTDTGSQKFVFNPLTITDPISPLDEVEVRVTYIADDMGDDDGALMIRHDDPLQSSVFVQLHGRTPSPDVDIRPDNLTIRIAHDSHQQTADIKIFNVGDEDLSVNGMDFSNPDGSFEIVSEPVWPATVGQGSIPAGPFETVQVKFEKYTQTADDECSLTFYTNDPDEGTVVVTVIGSYTP
ncbi:MAG TPA: choice-of-anchor D domain-containing protein [Myxococcota bacterium]|nr:choice-of-anchor D domain-containing protein [Myxococcota bacterium]